MWIGNAANKQSRKGFTLIELILVLGILSILFGITTVRFFGTQGKQSVVEAADILVADLRSQQTLAMTGAAINGVSMAGYGISWEGSKYILFAGDTYDPASTNNQVVELPEGVTITATFPNSRIIFARASGEVRDFEEGNNTIEITSESSTEARVIEINQLGVIVGGI